MSRVNFTNLLIFIFLMGFHFFFSTILIFNYSPHCEEGKIVENLQLLLLIFSMIIILFYNKKNCLIFFFFFFFIFFEEINWGYDFLPESFKISFLKNITDNSKGNLSFHNLFNHKVEDFFSAILLIFLIFPKIFKYLLPFIKFNKISNLFSFNSKIYIVSITIIYSIHAKNKIIMNNPLYEHANEEYFELMLYFIFFIIILFNLKYKLNKPSF